MPCAGVDRRSLALALALALVGGACHTPPTTTAPTPPSPTEPAAPAPPSTCGSSTTLVSAASALPRTPILLAQIELGDPERDAALGRLSSYARGEGHDLPLPAAFAMAQWSWEVALVRETFARLGFVAGELVVARFDHGSAVWSLPLGCAMTDALDRLRAREGWRVDDAGDAILATPPPAAALPFDLIVADGLVTLAPAGQGRTTLASMRRDAPTSELSMPERLGALEAAPVRVVVRGTALLGTGATAGSHALLRGLRVSAGALASASLPEP